MKDNFSREILFEIFTHIKSWTSWTEPWRNILQGLIWNIRNKKSVSINPCAKDSTIFCQNSPVFSSVVLLIKEQKCKILKYLCCLSLFLNWLSTSWTARFFWQPLINTFGMKCVVTWQSNYLWRFFFTEYWDVLFQNIVLQANRTLKSNFNRWQK